MRGGRRMTPAISMTMLGRWAIIGLAQPNKVTTRTRTVVRVGDPALQTVRQRTKLTGFLVLIALEPR
jgi:hypothetical protein